MSPLVRPTTQRVSHMHKWANFFCDAVLNAVLFCVFVLTCLNYQSSSPDLSLQLPPSLCFPYNAETMNDRGEFLASCTHFIFGFRTQMQILKLLPEVVRVVPWATFFRDGRRVPAACFLISNCIPRPTPKEFYCEHSVHNFDQSHQVTFAFFEFSSSSCCVHYLQASCFV